MNSLSAESLAGALAIIGVVIIISAKGATRLPPDHVAERAKELGLDKEAWLIAYCA